MNQYVGVYQDVGVKTADKQQQLLMLYEGAIKFTSQAKEMMAQGDKAGKAERLTKVISIIDALHGSLDPEVAEEFVENLSKLYEYMTLQVTKANISDNSDILDEVIRLLNVLHEGWVDAVNQNRAGNTKPLPNMETMPSAVSA